MSRATHLSFGLVRSNMVGTLMFGAALALAPVLGHAQTPAAATPPAAANPAAAPAAEGASAVAAMLTSDGKQAGTVTVSDTPSGALHVVASLSGIPAGPHAVHIHETGKCEAPKFESAGGHLADGKEHGALSAGGMHPGDMPNVEIPESGSATQEFFLAGVSVAQVMDADGGAFIVHGGVDDYTSQPSGNAGDRIACGVFEAAKATN